MTTYLQKIERAEAAKRLRVGIYSGALAGVSGPGILLALAAGFPMVAVAQAVIFCVALAVIRFCVKAE